MVWIWLGCYIVCELVKWVDSSVRLMSVRLSLLLLTVMWMMLVWSFVWCRGIVFEVMSFAVRLVSVVSIRWGNTLLVFVEMGIIGVLS